MANVGRLLAALGASLLTVAGLTAPAHAADPQLIVQPGNVGVYDPITVRFPGCSAQAMGITAVSSYWDVEGLDEALWSGGDYGYDSDIDDPATRAQESATQRWAYTAGPGTYRLTGDCVGIDGQLVSYTSATLAVGYSSYLPSDPDQAWAMIPGQNTLAVNRDGSGYRLIAQPDGNLVAYSPTGQATWSTGTWGKQAGAPVMQPDGNVVIYGPDGPLWWSGTSGNPGARLVVQPDGNVVIYSATDRPLWWTGVPAKSSLAVGERLTAGQRIVAPNGRSQLVMQSDGNLVLYGPRGAMWWSGTSGANTFVALQSDGNLVIYRGTTPIWWTGPKAGARQLALQDDGNLVLYSATGPLWWTGTRI